MILIAVWFTIKAGNSIEPHAYPTREIMKCGLRKCYSTGNNFTQQPFWTRKCQLSILQQYPIARNEVSSKNHNAIFFRNYLSARNECFEIMSERIMNAVKYAWGVQEH